jgi:hypothetical protein
MTSLTLYTKIETLPSKLKKEVKKFIEEMLESQNNDKENSKKSVLKERTFGSLKGKIHISDDFDAPLDEFKDYM